MDINNSFKEKRDNNKMDNTKSKKTLCEVCNYSMLSKNYKRHLVSKTHLKNLKQQDTGVEEKQEEKQEQKEEKQKEEKKEQPKTKPKPKQKQKKDKIKIAIPVSKTCSKDCLRQRELRLKKNPDLKIKPTPNREWLVINGELETTQARAIRLRRERQKRYRDTKRAERLKQKQNKK